MQFVQITPGAGGMYCGGCLRDNALVAEMRRRGHETLMIPLYLPLTLDEADQSGGTPIFFGGINVYLEQKSALFRRTPRWFHRWLASPRLLKWAAGRAARTQATELGDLTVSMLRGEQGHQARELEEMVDWFRTRGRPDVIGLSNGLLVGLARRLKGELGSRLVCTLQGEDYFLDHLPAPYRDEAWSVLAERAAEIDCFTAPSAYYAELMARRLGLPQERVQVVANGINLEGYEAAGRSDREAGGPPVLGYFARMCPEKGLDLLVEAFLLLKRRPATERLRLRVGGSCNGPDEAFVAGLRRRLESAGVSADVEFHPNVDRATKLALMGSFSVLSVPAHYGEAFGLYLLEAWAAGLPVVQPRTAAFPELIEATGGGVLVTPGEAAALADGIEGLILDPERARRLGEAGRRVVQSEFSDRRMVDRVIAVLEGASAGRGSGRVGATRGSGLEPG
jgi:glycosyltransferase involved in cell wall biosynthesis